MSPSYSTHTPRQRPLNYDSLEQDIGCQAMDGVQVYEHLPFIQSCAVEHDETDDSPFNQDPLVAYAWGPENTGDTFPFFRRWAAWLGLNTGIIRIGKFAKITRDERSDTLGVATSLFNREETKNATKLAMGFNRNGRLALAIEDGVEIDLRRFTGTDTTAAIRFRGSQPVIFNNGMLVNTEDADQDDLVIIYIEDGNPKSLLARFERDDFETAYVIAPDLPFYAEQLISTDPSGRKQVLLARDRTGRDLTLSSDLYGAKMDDALGVEVALDGGLYQDVSVETTAEDALGLSVELHRGSYADSVNSAGTVQDVLALHCELSSGSYHLASE